MNTEKVMGVLRRVEWGDAYEHCPLCHSPRRRGHREDCKLAALLSEGGKEKAQDHTPAQCLHPPGRHELYPLHRRLEIAEAIRGLYSNEGFECWFEDAQKDFCVSQYYEVAKAAWLAGIKWAYGRFRE